MEKVHSLTEFINRFQPLKLFLAMRRHLNRAKSRCEQCRVHWKGLSLRSPSKVVKDTPQRSLHKAFYILLWRHLVAKHMMKCSPWFLPSSSSSSHFPAGRTLPWPILCQPGTKGHTVRDPILLWTLFKAMESFICWPCCLVAEEGMVCTPSLCSSSWALCAWTGSCGGTGAGSVPNSASAVQGLWWVLVWSSESNGCVQGEMKRRAEERR